MTTSTRDLPSENNLGLSRSYQKNEFVLDIIILGVTIDKYTSWLIQVRMKFTKP